MLLTEGYRQEQEALHAKGNYGTASLKYGEVVSELVEMSGAATMLDYGCGSMRNLAKVLNCEVMYQGYDPGVKEYANEPDAADFVACIDVLEHIEPECLDAVIDHLASKCKHLAFVTIHTGPAAKVLSDGRNAHLIQETEAWWLPKLLAKFRLLKFQARNGGFEVLLKRLY